MNAIQDDAILDDGDALLKLPAVRKLVPLSVGEIYKRIKKGRFPRPVSLGPQSVAWRRSDILHWMANLPERRPEDR